MNKECSFSGETDMKFSRSLRRSVAIVSLTRLPFFASGHHSRASYVAETTELVPVYDYQAD